MRLVFLVRLAILAALVTLALPGGAEARRGYKVINRSLRLELFVASATNGYDFQVRTVGHHRVVLTVSRFLERAATYSTRGRVSRNRIEADFGRLGRIDVRFQRRARSHSKFPGLDAPDFLRRFRYCRGRKPVLESGRFHGTIRFRGEGGFTRVHQTSARGSVNRQYRRVCKRKGGPAARASARDPLADARTNYLVAVDRSPRRIVAFETVSLDFGAGLEELSEFFGVTAAVVVLEKREGMRIQRLAIAEGGPESLLLSPPGKDPVTATVTPPKPFHGTADFEKAKGSPPIWSGTLRAPVPGAGIIRLAEEAFQPTFCRFSLKRLFEPQASRCLRRSGIPLPGPFVIGQAIGAQIKGSQSQAFGDARLSWSR